MSCPIDDCALFVRNIPRAISKEDKIELFQLFHPIKVEIIGHQSARLQFHDPFTAKRCLQELHQVHLLGHRLNVKYARRGELIPCESASDQTPSQSLQSNIYQDLNINLPPPLEPRYKYPTATRTTVNKIADQLLNNPAFYTQTLHLMNRMNLPPPFQDDRELIQRPSTVETSCQTEGEWRKRPADLCTDESELSEEEEVNPLPIKRQKIRSQMDMHRYRHVIEMEKEARLKKDNVTQYQPKEPLTQLPLKKDIKLSLPAVLPPERKQSSPPNREIPPVKVNHPQTNAEITCSRLSLQELQENYPIFQNYNPGPLSTVLYIKNLAKTVTSQDLEQIFNRYSTDPSSVSVDLKTTGRLRGQAFIRFNEGDQGLVEKALQDTNGVMLKEKPLYVCFSKSATTGHETK